MIDMTTFDAMLKDKYSSEAVKDMVYPKAPAYALVSKREDSRGRRFVVPIKFSHTKGISSTFTTAQGNKSGASQYEDFLVTRKKWYGLADIDNEVLQASKGDPHAFAEAAMSEIDSTLQGLARKAGIDLYRDGTGALARLNGGAVTGTTVQLLNRKEISAFEVGMKVVVSETPGSALRSGGAANTLTAVNRNTGVLTGADWDATIAAIEANDYLYRQGDWNACISGFAAWVPDSDPSATPFFGVDRSVDVSRLGGLRQSAAGKTYQEALIDMGMELGDTGASPDTCFMSFADLAALVKELGNSVIRDQAVSPDRSGIGFKAIVVHTPAGDVKVVGDVNAPPGKCHMLQLDTWELHSPGPALGILQTDGLRVLRNSSTDSIEVRCGGYPQLVCHAPGYNGVITGLGT